MKKEKILIVGDLHGNWGPFNKLLNVKKPDIVLQVGDYGLWSHFHNTKNFYDKKFYLRNYGKDFGELLFAKLKPFDQYGVKNKNIPIHWCPGNHENWDVLDTYKDMHEIQPNIFYRDFGSTLQLKDGRTVMFCGGADSIDKHNRISGHSWWSQETISQKDMLKLPDMKVDIIISHTVPEEWFNELIEGANPYGKDPSCIALSVILDRYKPKLWYSGHFHQFKTGLYKDCKWICLNMPENGTGWWKWIQT